MVEFPKSAPTRVTEVDGRKHCICGTSGGGDSGDGGGSGVRYESVGRLEILLGNSGER